MSDTQPVAAMQASECNHNETVWLGQTESLDLGPIVRWCRKCGALRYGNKVLVASPDWRDRHD